MASEALVSSNICCRFSQIYLKWGRHTDHNTTTKLVLVHPYHTASHLYNPAEFHVPPFLDVLKHTHSVAPPEHPDHQHKVKNQHQNKQCSDKKQHDTHHPGTNIRMFTENRPVLPDHPGNVVCLHLDFVNGDYWVHFPPRNFNPWLINTDLVLRIDHLSLFLGSKLVIDNRTLKTVSLSTVLFIYLFLWVNCHSLKKNYWMFHDSFSFQSSVCLISQFFIQCVFSECASWSCLPVTWPLRSSHWSRDCRHSVPSRS